MNIRFKSHLVGGALALALITPLTACDPADEQTPAATSTVTAVADTLLPETQAPVTRETPALSNQDAAELVYITILESEGITDASNLSDSDLIDLGNAVCEYMGSNPNMMAASEIVYSGSTLTSYQSGYLVGTAVAAFCPEYLD